LGEIEIRGEKGREKRRINEEKNWWIGGWKKIKNGDML
jgi:hypothetical protein